jgi:hypothetical protein
MSIAPRPVFDEMNVQVDYLLADRYETHIRKLIRGGQRIANMSDAHRYQLVTLIYYCEKCVGTENQAQAWNDLLKGMGLFGVGYDYIVRGSYKGVVMLRYASNQLLIVESTSVFADEVKALPAQPPSPLKLLEGIQLRLSSDGQDSCDAVCEAGGLSCHEQLMHIPNECDILKQVYGCNSCEMVSGNGLPSVGALISADKTKCKVQPMVRDLSCQAKAVPNSEEQLFCGCGKQTILQLLSK